MIHASADGAWSTAGTPSGWRWRRPAGCCRIWRPCWAGSPATTPGRCTRATPSTASCTSSRPSRPTTAGCWGCGRWSTRSATTPTTASSAGLAFHRAAVLSAGGCASSAACMGRRHRRAPARRGLSTPTRSLAGRAALHESRPARPHLGGWRHPAAAHRRRLVRAHAAARRRRRGAAGPAGVDAVAAIRGPAIPLGGNRSTADVVDRAQLLDIAAAALGEASAAAPRSGAAAPARAATSRRAAGRRLVVDVGGPAVRAAPGPRGRHRRQGGEPDAARRHPPRRAGVLRLDERRKALLCRRFRLRGRAAPAARCRRRRDRVLAAGGAATAHWAPTTVSGRPGRIWLRINGYRDQPDRPAFGDDAAVAGGLVGAAADGPVFCGDAIADPLSGLEAARAVGESLRRGGGEVIDVSMAQVAARYAALPTSDAALPRPHRRRRCRRRRRLGADNDAVERLVAERLARHADSARSDARRHGRRPQVSDRIDEVAATLTPRPGEDVLDAAGGTVLPGLHDHHVHLHSAAAAATSVRVGPPQVRDRADWPRALAERRAGDDGWIRAVGYHDSVAGPLDRDALDASSTPRRRARPAPQWRAVDAELGGAGSASV